MEIRFVLSGSVFLNVQHSKFLAGNCKIEHANYCFIFALYNFVLWKQINGHSQIVKLLRTAKGAMLVLNCVVKLKIILAISRDFETNANNLM